MSAANLSRVGRDNSYDIVVHAYLLMATLMGTGLISIAPHVFLTLAKSVVMVCIISAAVYCYLNRLYAPAFISAFALIYGVLVQLQFASISGASISITAGYPVYAFGGVAVMYVALRDDPNRLAKVLLQYAAWYVILLFVFAHVPLLKKVLASTPLVGLGHGGSHGRLQMLFLYPLLIAAVGLDGFLRGQIRGAKLWLVLAALICIVFSDFRMGTMLTLGGLFCYALMRLTSFSLETIARVFAYGTALIIALLAILYILDLNPYFFIFQDRSAFARALGFYLIRDVARFSPLLGLGIQPDSTVNLSGRDTFKFYDSDYGVFGIIVWGGFIALTLYLIVIFMSYRFASDARRIGLAPRYVGGFALTGWIQLTYNITSPTNMFEGNVEFACLIIAAALLAREKMRPLARTKSY